MFLLVVNFCQFKGATTLRKYFYWKNFFGQIFNKNIGKIIILKDLNKFPITQFVYNQMLQFFYEWLPL